MNTLQHLINLYPAEMWPYVLELSANPNITPDFIEQHIDKPWNWNMMSINPSITLRFIEQHLDKDWDWNLFVENPNITQEFVGRHIDENWDWLKLTKKSYITVEFIIRHRNKPWDWIWLSVSNYPNPNYPYSKPNMTPRIRQYFRQREYDFENNKWTDTEVPGSDDQIHDPMECQFNPKHQVQRFALKYVMRQLHEPWFWEVISKNTNLTPNFIEQNIDKDWDWEALSRSLSITPEIIANHHNKAWEWDELSSNPCINPRFVDRHLNWPWNWEYLSQNPNITIDFIANHINQGWDWCHISNNKFLFCKDLHKVQQQTFNVIMNDMYRDMVHILHQKHGGTVDVLNTLVAFF